MGHVKWRYFGVEKLMKICYYLNENPLQDNEVDPDKGFSFRTGMVFQPARYCDLPYGNMSRFSPVTDLGAAFNKSLKQKSAPLRSANSA